MSIPEIEEMCFTVADSATEEILAALIRSLRGLDDLFTPEVVAGIDFMLEAWGASIDDSRTKSEFCLNLAKLSPSDTPILRISLQKAFSNLKKSDFLKSTIVKATGVRNPDVDPKTAAERFMIVESIYQGMLAFNPSAQRFGEIIEMDSMTSELVIRWSGSRMPANLALDAAICDILFLKTSKEKIALPDTSKNDCVKAKQWRTGLKKAAVLETNDKTALQMAMTLANESEIPHEQIMVWWNADEQTTNTSATRHPSKARTIQELHSTLLACEGAEMSDDELADMGTTLKSLKIKNTSEPRLLAESLAMLTENLPAAVADLCVPIAADVAFWPEAPSKPANIADLTPWSAISMKQLVSLAELTVAVFSAEYLAELALRLPLRCWNPISSVAGSDNIVKALKSAADPPPDALLWIWKNKTAAKEISTMLTTKSIAAALDSAGSSPAANQLKKLLISDRNLQKSLLDNANAADMMRELYAIQACESLRLDEKQSLLVKLSALSSELKTLLENGEGERLFSEVSRKHLEKQKEDEPLISSKRSMIEMTARLNDLISKQIPENAAAIAHARSYGDLKENAEYKAAKERQAFLQKRTSEIERAVNETLPFDFSTVKPGTEAVPGSSVTLAIVTPPEMETVHLLGAWDGDPENNIVAYTSALGSLLNGKSVGDEFEMPDERHAVVESVSKLPNKLLLHLSNEKK
ncbi:MAG: GreA/GreB family elongation factor [Victivallales bacterium]|nr:GreA/GreB family elongation factor [Victivallales bacterium]